MLSIFTRNVCCSVRDKDMRARSLGRGADMAHFTVGEVNLPTEKPSLMAFSPLWQSNVVGIRRLAVTGERVVNVYNLSSQPHNAMLGVGVGSEESAAGTMQAERTLVLEEGHEITAVLFGDEDTSRHLILAYGPSGCSSSSTSGPAQGRFPVRIWNCEPDAGSTDVWRQDHGYIASLEDHRAPVTRIAVSSTYLLTADTGGECRVWQKSRKFQPRAVARLHQSGGVSDLAVDRLFAYSVGGQDLSVRVWSMPEMKQVLNISADTAECALALPIAPSSEASMLPSCSCRLSQLTAVRRPTSRWSGAQASTRNSGIPRGVLFVAGTVADKQDSGAAVCAGAGVLMEWALGSTPCCQSSQVAHDSPIVALAYGPYDNGPLVTADAWGVFRVWDYTPRLWCSQQVLTEDLAKPTTVAISVDPIQRTVYSIVCGRKLCVWRQQSSLADQAA